MEFCSDVVQFCGVPAVEHDVEVFLCELAGVLLAYAVAGAGYYRPGRCAVVRIVVVIAGNRGAAEAVDPDEFYDLPGEEGRPDCTDQGENE